VNRARSVESPPTIPPDIPPGATIYLCPRGLLAGEEAGRAVDAGQALPLAGGPLGFEALDVLWRAPKGPRQPTRLSLTDFQSWISSLKGEQSDEARRQLENLVRPRAVLASINPDSRIRPLVMGIVNVTPDSFSDGGRFLDPERAVEHGRRLIADGADILDIGGESTRPGAKPITVQEEIDRVLPVIERLKDAGMPISIDTRHAEVMRTSLAAGAVILNDVTALTHDPESLGVAAASGGPVVLMHMQGEPGTMQDNPRYDDVIMDILDYLSGRIEACEAAGLPRTRLVADPGIGFGKAPGHNLELLEGLAAFHALGTSLLLGASRKRFIGALDPKADKEGRLGGSIAAALAGAARGAQILRVHDVRETVQALAVTGSIARLGI
jgi:dihydropteroate synthase